MTVHVPHERRLMPWVVTEELRQTLEVEVFRMVQRLFPCGKESPVTVSGQDGRSSSPPQDTLELPSLTTLDRTMVNDSAADSSAERALQSRSDCCIYEEPVSRETSLHSPRAPLEAPIETQIYS